MADASSPSGSSSLVRLVEKWRSRAAEEINPRLYAPSEFYESCATTLLLRGSDWTRTAYWATRIGTWVVDCVVPLSVPLFWMPLPPVPETKA